jgi:hypothetical protein
MAHREVDEQALHDHLVRLLRLEYYNYPNQKHPHLIASANHPNKTKAVYGPGGAEYFPDIVVMDERANKPSVVVEVETVSTVNQEELEEWAVYGRIGCLVHLYVPRGTSALAASLCEGLPGVEIIEYHKEAGKYIIERRG